MNAQLVQMAPIPIAMIRHTGPYEETSAVFDRLWEWVEAHGVPAGRTIGIYYDNPDYVPAHQLRSAACVEVPNYFQLSDRGGLPITMDHIAAGNYVTTSYTGPYENLGPIWSNFTVYIEQTMGAQILDKVPAFEVYVNDASDTPPNQLITELYMPVR